MSILRFHWIRFIGAIGALLLAVLYLTGFERLSMCGFGVIGLITVFLFVRMHKGTLPAYCDLCGRKGMLKVEYGYGYTNVRLVLNCPGCGRVVNTARNGIEPGKERDVPVPHSIGNDKR